jgi:hypothetical protein
MSTPSTFSSNPLGYEGIDFYQNPPFIPAQRPPTSYDQELPGTVWQDKSVNPPVLYITTGAGSWSVLSTSSGFIATLTGNTGGAISPSAGNISIVGTGSVSVAGSGSTLTISSTSSSITWQTIATSTAASVNNGYVCTAALTLALPAGPAQGDVVNVMTTTSAQVIITAQAGQTITVGTTTSASGGTTKNTTVSTINLIWDGISSWRAMSVSGTWTTT